jgi:hypothetical protein
MCLLVSRLFWVSSLAYPNLLGTKGYVVVVDLDLGIITSIFYGGNRLAIIQTRSLQCGRLEGVQLGPNLCAVLTDLGL